MAVRSTPAAVASGGRARLDALVAGPDGILDAELAWSLSTPGGAAIEVDEDGTWLTVGDVEVGSVEVALAATTESAELHARKSVAIGADADNPGPMGIEADGQRIDADALQVAPGAVVALRAGAAGVEEADVSWFATVGEIELYRRNPTELTAPEDPSSGWLIAVVRDGSGGVTWQVVSLVVGGGAEFAPRGGS